MKFVIIGLTARQNVLDHTHSSESLYSLDCTGKSEPDGSKRYKPVFESRNGIALDLYPTDSLHIVFENRSGLEALCNGIL